MIAVGVHTFKNVPTMAPQTVQESIFVHLRCSDIKNIRNLILYIENAKSNVQLTKPYFLIS